MPRDDLFKQVFYYRCRGDDIPLLSLKPASIADFLPLMPAIHVQHWHEDGLGPHRGFNIRLTVGIVVKLAENPLGRPVVIIYGDSQPITEKGLSTSIQAIINELRIDPALIEWQQTEEGLATIHQGYLSWLSSRQSGTPVPQ